MCPQLSVRQRLRSGMSNLYSHYRSWTQLVRRTVCPIVCGIGGMRIHRSDGKLISGAGMNELPAITENQQNRDWNQWSSWLSSNDWNWWSSWPTRADDEKWSSWSPWSHSVVSESKKYFDKIPPPEWDGSQPEKTWRDYRRMLKQWLSTTDVPVEKHGMLLWRALTGDAKASHFTFPR